MYTNLIPTGFRFNPTDEELLLFLRNKANGNQLPPYIPITNEDVYAREPYDLPCKFLYFIFIVIITCFLNLVEVYAFKLVIYLS